MAAYLIDARYLALSTFVLIPALCAGILCWLTSRRAKSILPIVVLEKPAEATVPSRKSQLDLDKALYHQLHNLEDNHDCLSAAHNRLVSLLAETLSDAMAYKEETILSATPTYSKEALEAFLTSQHNSTCQRYENYLSRRKEGAAREMFPDRATAIYWLRNSLCVKYVDGGWVGHLHKVTTMARDRPATAVAWQVGSEELGDGSISKNHVHLIEELMREIGHEMPKPWDPAFIKKELNLEEARCWKAAIAQLTISLFPDRFLPEAIGFNLAYETLPYHLLVSIKELKELKINPYYFVLHVAIDNGHSGHAAMGLEAARRYIEAQPENERADIWKRVMAGYILAEGLPTTPDLTNVPLDRQMSDLMYAKSLNSHQLHASSSVKIAGGQRLHEWLHPSNFTPGETNYTFLRQLGSATPWVVKGYPEKSLLMKEIRFGGRMFGAFTSKEQQLMEQWITKLGLHQVKFVDNSVYYNFTNTAALHRFPSYSKPLKDLSEIVRQPAAPRQHLSKQELDRLIPTNLSARLLHSQSAITPQQKQRLLALHFISLSLLENMITQPARCSNQLGMHVVQALRALHGLEETAEEEDAGVSGMDQVHDSAPSFYDLGQAMCQALGVPVIQSLEDVADWSLPEDDRCFLAALLRLSSQHVRQQALLLGLALGCSETLHSPQLCSSLAVEERSCMQALMVRESRALRLAIECLSNEGKREAQRGQRAFAARVAMILQAN